MTTLPSPSILPALDVSALKTQRLAEFKQLLPTWNAELESDPIVKLIELLAYVETIDNAEENSAILSNFLGYAEGERLDELAKFYQLQRLVSETDERFRVRLELHISGMSGMGTTDYYRAQALSVAVWVKDAHISTGQFGQLFVTIWTASDAPQDAAQIAFDYLSSKSRRMATDTINVSLATPRILNIRATLYRSVSTPVARVNDAKIALQASLDTNIGLGATLTKAWLIGRLAIDGIKNIELISPIDDLICAQNEYPLLGIFDVIDGGLL